jgi:hypothetical protein
VSVNFARSCLGLLKAFQAGRLPAMYCAARWVLRAAGVRPRIYRRCRMRSGSSMTSLGGYKCPTRVSTCSTGSSGFGPYWVGTALGTAYAVGPGVQEALIVGGLIVFGSRGIARQRMKEYSRLSRRRSQNLTAKRHSSYMHCRCEECSGCLRVVRLTAGAVASR